MFNPERVKAMKKRAKRGSKAAKTRPVKALKPKGRSASKTPPHPGAAPAGETEIARLTRALSEAVEQQRQPPTCSRP